MIILAYVLTALVSYLLGSINAGIIISKLIAKKDIRTMGSGNAGATNVFRIMGLSPAIYTVIIDFLKATASVLLAIGFFKWLCPGVDSLFAQCVASFFSVIGHMYPVYFGFRGGKGVMTLCGGLIVIHPIYTLISFGAFLVIVFISKYVSLGSILSCLVYLMLVAFVPLCKGEFTTAVAFELIINSLTVIMVIFRHRTNIKRLLNKTENKIKTKSR